MAGLFDYEFQLEKIKKHQPPLQKLNEIIDWELFRQPIEESLMKEDKKSNAGRKPYDNLTFAPKTINKTSNNKHVITT